MTKILVVEDEPLIQKTLTLLLQRKGSQTKSSSSGTEAIKMIAEEDFDCIVCDLMLKDITGFDVIEEAKKKMTSDEIKNKFIIITAYSSAQVQEKAASYGCQVIPKPFHDINKVINQIMEFTK